MDPNKYIHYVLFKRKYNEDVSRAVKNYSLLHGEVARHVSARWYDLWLSRLGTIMVDWGLRLEERCAICSEQLLGEKRQPTGAMGRK